MEISQYGPPIIPRDHSLETGSCHDTNFVSTGDASGDKVGSIKAAWIQS